MDYKKINHQAPVFKIYQQEFTCSCCGEKSMMGIVGYSEKYPKICDLCLVDEMEENEKIKEQVKDNAQK